MGRHSTSRAAAVAVWSLAAACSGRAETERADLGGGPAGTTAGWDAAVEGAAGAGLPDSGPADLSVAGSGPGADSGGGASGHPADVSAGGKAGGSAGAGGGLLDAAAGAAGQSDAHEQDGDSSDGAEASDAGPACVPEFQPCTTNSECCLLQCHGGTCRDATSFLHVTVLS
jgi:hypothetical protein